MSEYLLMFAALITFTAQTLCLRQFNRYYMKNLTSYFVFNFLYFAIVTATYYLIKPTGSDYHRYSIVLGIIFGLLFVLTLFFYVKGMETGPLSLTSLFFSLGLIIPVLSGLLLWGEDMGVLQVIGLLLLLITFYLGSGSSASPDRNANVKWFAFSFAAFLGNGLLMTLTKGHQVLLPGRQVMEYLFVCFSTAALSSFLTATALIMFKKQDIRHLKSRNFALVVIGMGATTAIGNLIMFILAGRVEGVILFPVVNGGVVVLSSIASMLLFKEKLGKKGIVGLIVGMASIVLLSLQ